MTPLLLLLLITGCYAAYNLLVKVSGSHTEVTAAPILATISLQLAALSVSLICLAYLNRGNINIALPGKVYFWAVLAGVCIGTAEVMYFYLFRGLGGEKPMAANVAIPFIVGGTIAVVVLVSHFVFRESMGLGQWIGVSLAFAGMIVLGLSSR